jgi:hypothetical protein
VAGRREGASPMVEQVQFVNISELTCIRLTCPGCNSTIECDLRNAGLAFKDDKCRVCGEIVCHSEKMGAFANALEALASVANAKKSSIGFSLKKTIPE